MRFCQKLIIRATTSDGVSMGGYIGSKFESFLFDPLLRNIFSQKRSTLDLRRLMDERKILLVNLAKGELTETNSRFFGMVFMSKLLAATMERVKQPIANRSDYYIYVDEFQNYATQNFITLLSEGRKFGVNLILANQFLTQVSDRIMDSIFGNVGTIVTFRLGQKDAEIMGKRFSPTISESDLIGLPIGRLMFQQFVMVNLSRPLISKRFLIILLTKKQQQR